MLKGRKDKPAVIPLSGVHCGAGDKVESGWELSRPPRELNAVLAYGPTLKQTPVLVEQMGQITLSLLPSLYSVYPGFRGASQSI